MIELDPFLTYLGTDSVSGVETKTAGFKGSGVELSLFQNSHNS